MRKVIKAKLVASMRSNPWIYYKQQGRWMRTKRAATIIRTKTDLDSILHDHRGCAHMWTFTVEDA
jgi:hypothetical protein